MYSFTKKEFSAVCYSLPHALPNGGGGGWEVKYEKQRHFQVKYRKKWGSRWRANLAILIFSAILTIDVISFIKHKVSIPVPS